MKIPRRLPRYLVEQTGLQSLLVIAIVVFGFLLVENAFVRWDLTEDNRFTISEASHRMAADLEDPLTIRVYMSANVPPRYQPLQRQVRDVLEEYKAASGGKIKVELYDPIETQTAENEARNYGIQPVQLPIYEATSVQVLQVYGGIVLVYRDRASEVINVAERYLQGYEGLSILEYEISSKIWQLSHERPKLGLAGYLEGMPQQPPLGPNRQPPRSEFQGLRRLLGESFEIEEVNLKEKQPDPKEMPLLALVRPREMSDVEVFRLDQYLMKGGRLLMFVTQGTIDVTPWDRRWLYRSFQTGLDDWLAALGLRIPNEFVLHGRNANMEEVEVTVLGNMKGRMAVPSWWRPIISSKSAIDQDNPAVRNLDTIALFWPHPVDVIEGKVPEGVEATVLVKSHEGESWRWKDHTRISRSAVDERADGPRRSDLQASPVVVSLEGDFTSYFADHPVPPSLSGGEKEEEKSEGEEENKEDAAESTGPEVVKKSVRPTHIVVVGNSVFISDIVLGGQQANERARQATLLAFNLIDWLARSEELIALRAKKYSNRTIVDEDFEADLESLKEDAEAGEMTEQTFREEFDKAREQHMQRRKRWRWINIIVPSFVVLVAAALVWIVRAAFRATPPRVPEAVAPSSVGALEDRK